MSDGTKTTDPKPAATGNKCGNFCVELGNSRGQYIAVQSLRRTFRGAFSLAGLHDRIGNDGKPIGGRPVGDAMSQIPDTPGIRLELDADSCRVREFDPLANDPETLARACRVLGRAKGGVDMSMKPHPEVVHTLDTHTFKTLVRELRRICDAGNARIVSGKLPTAEAINALPGRYLHDPWNSSPQFRFESEYEAWLDSRRRVGSDAG